MPDKPSAGPPADDGGAAPRAAAPAEDPVKAALAREIARHLNSRGLSQVKAARLLGVDQPKVSALLHGRLAGFSLERLFRFLSALGWEVEIVIREGPQGRARARLRAAPPAGDRQSPRP